jgi:NAD(P)-dependent dehydrogenase (short-subunit alcohol dehydrogenase family)
MSNLSESGIETLALDVTVPESILALKDEIVKRTGGKLDILYNNAGSSKSFSSRTPIRSAVALPVIAKSLQSV